MELEKNDFSPGQQNTIESKAEEGELSEERKRELIESAETLDGLIDIIVDNKIGLQGSKRFYSSEELQELIKDVKEQRRMTQYITRACGLRDTVARLLEIRKKM